MLNTARLGGGFTPEQVGSTFVTKRGETLFGSFAACKLLEVNGGTGRKSGYTTLSKKSPVTRRVTMP